MLILPQSISICVQKRILNEVMAEHSLIRIVILQAIILIIIIVHITNISIHIITKAMEAITIQVTHNIIFIIYSIAPILSRLSYIICIAK